MRSYRSRWLCGPPRKTIFKGAVRQCEAYDVCLFWVSHQLLLALTRYSQYIELQLERHSRSTAINVDTMGDERSGKNGQENHWTEQKAKALNYRSRTANTCSNTIVSAEEHAQDGKNTLINSEHSYSLIPIILYVFRFLFLFFSIRRRRHGQNERKMKSFIYWVLPGCPNGNETTIKVIERN